MLAIVSRAPSQCAILTAWSSALREGADPSSATRILRARARVSVDAAGRTRDSVPRVATTVDFVSTAHVRPLGGGVPPGVGEAPTPRGHRLCLACLAELAMIRYDLGSALRAAFDSLDPVMMAGVVVVIALLYCAAVFAVAARHRVLAERAARRSASTRQHAQSDGSGCVRSTRSDSF